MRTMTFAEACAEFEKVFQLAVGGETVVIEREAHRVTLQLLPEKTEAFIAPPGFFAEDYSREEIAELNAFAAQGPRAVLP
jgi:hypothetical protein